MRCSQRGGGPGLWLPGCSRLRRCGARLSVHLRPFWAQTQASRESLSALRSPQEALHSAACKGGKRLNSGSAVVTVLAGHFILRGLKGVTGSVQPQPGDLSDPLARTLRGKQTHGHTILMKWDKAGALLNCSLAEWSCGKLRTMPSPRWLRGPCRAPSGAVWLQVPVASSEFSCNLVRCQLSQVHNPPGNATANSVGCTLDDSTMLCINVYMEIPLDRSLIVESLFHVGTGTKQRKTSHNHCSEHKVYGTSESALAGGRCQLDTFFAAFFFLLLLFAAYLGKSNDLPLKTLPYIAFKGTPPLFMN